MTLWILAMLPLGIAGIVLVALLRELLSRSSSTEFDPAWLDDFSIAKYRPMLRLLSEDDYRFLANQPGYQVKMASQLRAERRKVFRAYLRNLVRDFHRLHHAAKLMAVYSAHDRPELAQALMRQQVTFSVAVLSVKARLMLHFGRAAQQIHDNNVAARVAA